MKKTVSRRGKQGASGRLRSILCLGIIALAIPLCSPASLFAANPITLDIAIQSIEHSEPPRLVGDIAIFSCKPEGSGRFIGARFAHEGYAVLHPYARNDNGVFVLDYQVPEGVREIRYRMVVDGLWMNDPANLSSETDELGNAISVFTIEREPARTLLNPKLEADGGLTFTYRGQAGLRISIAGDFNDWDPFIDFLQEIQPGLFRITLRVLPGRHFYYFYSNGSRIIDPANPETGVDPSGRTVSYFLTPS